MKKKRWLFLLAGAWSLLLIPFIAMFFTHEVQWDAADFIIMALLLASVVAVIELVLRKVPVLRHRLILIAVALLLFILVWAELAVGIFGTSFAGS